MLSETVEFVGVIERGDDTQPKIGKMGRIGLDLLSPTSCALFPRPQPVRQLSAYVAVVVVMTFLTDTPIISLFVSFLVLIPPSTDQLSMHV